MALPAASSVLLDPWPRPDSFQFKFNIAGTVFVLGVFGDSDSKEKDRAGLLSVGALRARLQLSMWVCDGGRITFK